MAKLILALNPRGCEPIENTRAAVFSLRAVSLLMSKQATAMRANVTTELPKSPQFRQFQTRHQAFFYGQTLTQGIARKKNKAAAPFV